MVITLADPEEVEVAEPEPVVEVVSSLLAPSKGSRGSSLMVPSPRTVAMWVWP